MPSGKRKHDQGEELVLSLIDDEGSESKIDGPVLGNAPDFPGFSNLRKRLADSRLHPVSFLKRPSLASSHQLIRPSIYTSTWMLPSPGRLNRGSSLARPRRLSSWGATLVRTGRRGYIVGM